MATVTSLPGRYDMPVYRGDTKEITIDFADAADETAVDISGWTWLAQVRASLDEPGTILATFDVDDTSAAAGQLTVTLSADESAALETVNGKATYYWDLQGTQSAVVKTWLTGKVKVYGDVTVAP